MNSLELLAQARREERLTHAYLAPVRSGTPLENYAAELGRIILCPGNDDECGGKVLRNTHPDFFWITVLNDKSKISINQVDDVISSSSYSPQESDKKVYALGKAEDLSLEAANSLLKILEDPPGYVFFLLLTENRNNLLPTILSRCQQLPKGGTELSGMRDALTESGFDEAAVDYLMGVVNNRADLLDQLLESGPENPIEYREKVIEKFEDSDLGDLGASLVEADDLIEKDGLARLIFRKIYGANRYEVLTLAENLKDLPDDQMTWFLERGLNLYRDAYRRKLSEKTDSGDFRSARDYVEMARLISNGIEGLKTNANVQLLVESLCLQLGSGDASVN